MALLVAGLLSSFFHLGRPGRAWRSAARWRTSWMSREVIVLPAFMGAVFVWALIHYLEWNTVLFTFGNNIEVNVSLLMGAFATLLCFTLFLCTGMIYACLKMLQEWASPLTVINYTLLGGSSGFILATVFAAWQSSGMTWFFGGCSVVLTLLAFLTRAASLYRNARLRHKSSLQTAIGIRHTDIQQTAQGAMGGSFNTREYFHGASKRKYRFVKWAFLVLAFPLPLLLLSVGLGAHVMELLVAAFLVQYIGLLMERWFFFAQANHPQNLYYQTV
jgi:DMSO reductase anchor subunit